jgi:hypothetical protein
VTGPWSREQIRQHLRGSVIPIRLASRTRSGFPLVLSLWFTFRDGFVWCAVQRNARVAQHLERDPRCAFEVAADDPPYRGVRGQGHAEIRPAEGEAVLRELIDRYLGDASSDLARWLLGRADREVAIRIQPVRFATWDFTRRMQRAIERS